MSDQLQPHLAALFAKSLDPAHVAQANVELTAAESQPGFSAALLNIIKSNDAQASVRQMAAIYLKNFISRSWASGSLNQQEQASVRDAVVPVMLNSPPAVQAQLTESIRLMAGRGFHEQWPTLVKELSANIATENPARNNAIYRTLHSIFLRWREESASDDLFLEILHVFTDFGAKFIEMVQITNQAIPALAADKAQLELWVEGLTHLAELFYDLTCHDLVESMESNFNNLWSIFFGYLTYTNPLLTDDGDDETPSPVEKLKVAIFEVLNRHVEQYSESFQPEAFQGMLGQTVNLVSELSDAQKYDILYCRCCSLLISLSRFVGYSSLPESDLKAMVEKIVLPNVPLRESDIDSIDDEPLDFIQRDLVGMEQETRRRSATDFLRALMTASLEKVTAITFGYVEAYLQRYSTDKVAHWAYKDMAITLFRTISSRGQGTVSHGVTELNTLVDVPLFYETHIIPELSASEGNVIILVDAVKFLYSFRNQLPDQHYRDLFPRLVDLLSSKNPCVYTVSAMALTEMIPKITSGKSISENMMTYSQLLGRLFKLILNPSSTQEQQGNEYLMRCAMRTFFSMGPDITAVVDTVSQPLYEIMQTYLRSTSNPRFSYFYFETLGTLIRFAPPTSQSGFEFYTSFFSSLSSMTDSDYSAYIMQLLSGLLESSDRSYPTGGGCVGYYQDLFASLLKLDTWKVNPHNTNVLARLFSLLVDRFSAKIAEANQLTNVLGIFQLLHSNFVSAPFVEASFCILRAVFTTFDLKAQPAYLNSIFGLLLNKLASPPQCTQEQRKFYATQFSAFYHFLFVAKVPFTIVELIKLFGELSLPAEQINQMHSNFIFKFTPLISDPIDRKTAIYAETKILSESTVVPVANRPLLSDAQKALVGLLVNPPQIASDKDLLTGEVDEMSFNAKVTLLRSTQRRAADPLSKIPDIAAWVNQTLSAAVRDSDAKNGPLRSVLDPAFLSKLSV